MCVRVCERERERERERASERQRVTWLSLNVSRRQLSLTQSQRKSLSLRQESQVKLSTMSLRDELLKSIWHAFTALDVDKSGKVSKSQLKVKQTDIFLWRLLFGGAGNSLAVASHHVTFRLSLKTSFLRFLYGKKSTSRLCPWTQHRRTCWSFLLPLIQRQSDFWMSP